MTDLIDDNGDDAEPPKDYKDEYSEQGFWDKLSKYAKTAGQEVVEKVLLLYYVMVDEKTSVANKAIALAALGYFISPVDAIPDVIAVVGFADDLGVIVAALTALSSSITDEIKAKAKAKTQEWFN